MDCVAVTFTIRDRYAAAALGLAPAPPSSLFDVHLGSLLQRVWDAVTVFNISVDSGVVVRRLGVGLRWPVLLARNQAAQVLDGATVVVRSQYQTLEVLSLLCIAV
jgi:hypothetical protein